MYMYLPAPGGGGGGMGGMGPWGLGGPQGGIPGGGGAQWEDKQIQVMTVKLVEVQSNENQDVSAVSTDEAEELDTAEGHLKNQRRVIKASESLTIPNNGNKNRSLSHHTY